GAVGSVCRYLLGTVAIQRHTQAGFPVGTLVVNVVGSILIGVLVRVIPPIGSGTLGRAALIVGFCGGFTTFSSFSLETVTLIQAGEWIKALSYVLASVLACVAGTAIGMKV